MSPNKKNDNLSNSGGSSAPPSNIAQQERISNEKEASIISKPLRIKNYCSDAEHYDTLHRQAPQVSLNIYCITYWWFY